MIRARCALFLLAALATARADGQVPPDVGQAVERAALDQAVLDGLEKMRQDQQEQERKWQDEQRTRENWMHWIEWAAIGLAAGIGSAAGGWGALRSKNNQLSTDAASQPASAEASAPGVAEVGLGTEGTGGVLLRSIPQWRE
jgi:hypothetical protein